MKKEVKFAFVKTSPIMVSYFFVSCAYGLVMAQGGFGWVWSMLCSTFIYTGTFQMVLASFFSSGAAFVTVILTCVFMSARQIFLCGRFQENREKTALYDSYIDR